MLGTRAGNANEIAVEAQNRAVDAAAQAERLADLAEKAATVAISRRDTARMASADATKAVKQLPTLVKEVKSPDPSTESPSRLNR